MAGLLNRLRTALRPRRFADLRVGTKIVGVSLVVALIFGTVGVIGLVHTRQLAAQQDHQYQHNVVALSHVTQLRQALAVQQQAVLAHILSEPGFYRDGYARDIVETDQRLTAELAALSRLELTPTQRSGVEALKNLITPWRGARDTALEASRLDDRPRATSIMLVRSEAMAEALQDRADTLHNDLVETVATGARQARSSSQATAALILTLLVAGSVVAVSLSVVVARTISRPLRNAVEVFAGVGRGDFSQRLAVDSRDEVGQMAGALNQTLVALDHAFAAMRHQAFHDGLTGLANRSLFRQRVEQALLKTGRGSTTIALLLIDIDNFKGVNDRYGHGAGDALLITVGRRLRQAVRPDDTVARLGGDEFAVLLDGVATPTEAFAVADRCLRAIQRPVTAEPATIHPQSSIGVAPWRGHIEVDQFLHDADAAMYAAKTAGRGRVSSLADLPPVTGDGEVTARPVP